MRHDVQKEKLIVFITIRRNSNGRGSLARRPRGKRPAAYVKGREHQQKQSKVDETAPHAMVLGHMQMQNTHTSMAMDWTPLCEKYKGLWVALNDDEQTVVGSGKTL
jgi:hypothetical protein